jgi:hypothetical protein
LLGQQRFIEQLLLWHWALPRVHSWPLATLTRSQPPLALQRPSPPPDGVQVMLVRATQRRPSAEHWRHGFPEQDSQHSPRSGFTHWPLPQLMPLGAEHWPLPMQVLQSGQRLGWPFVQHVLSETQALPHVLLPGRSRQLPLLHSRQVPLQPGPATPSWVFWQRLPWQDLQAPQSLSPQQLPSTQLPPQFRRPSGHIPLQAWVRGMHESPQRWKPWLQLKSQRLPSQLGVEFAGAGQRSQRSPQELTLRLSLHCWSQSWKPPRQVKTQALFSHLTLAFSRAPQGEQLSQKLTSLFGTQLPLQSFWPLGQTPLQAWPLGMQAPAHSLEPLGHSAPHLPSVQVALPPVGTGQGEQDAPQLVGLVSSKQLSSHL